jgi:transcription termination factor NusB
MGLRRKARECALQMLFAADVATTRADELLRLYWEELSDEADAPAQEFAARVVDGRACAQSRIGRAHTAPRRTLAHTAHGNR